MGYPKAALFGFCMALVTYNLLSVVRAAVQAVHGKEAASWLSTYYMAHEVASTNIGMSIVLEGAFWKNKYAKLTPTQMAHELKRLARNMRLTKYKKAKWTPKKKRKKKELKEPPNHASTFRVLQESRKAAANAA